MDHHLCAPHCADAGDRTVTQTAKVSAWWNFIPVGEADGFAGHCQTV